MKVYICIGNSDDKLSQRQWRDFIDDIRGWVHTFAQAIHGEWFSEPVSKWQNACWCVEVHDENAQEFKDKLRKLAAAYDQDSIIFDEVPETVMLVPGRAEM